MVRYIIIVFQMIKKCCTYTNDIEGYIQSVGLFGPSADISTLLPTSREE